MHRKSVYRNNKFEISASNWNEEFDLSKASYSISDIQKSVLSILQKKLGTMEGDYSVETDINNIENRIVFKIKTGYKL